MSTDAYQVPAEAAAGAGERVWTSYSARERTLLTLGAVASYLIFSAVGRSFSIPLLEDYQGREAMAAGEAFDPSPANIDARTEVSTLDNEAELALLAKSTRGEAVQVRSHLYMGDEASLTDRATASQVVAAMLTRGTKAWTAPRSRAG